MKAGKFRTLAILAVGLGLCATGAIANRLISVYADESGTATATTTIADADGFDMTKGAQVRLPKSASQDDYDETGIRFTVNLQEDYIEQLNTTYSEVTFYSFIAVNGAEVAIPEGFTGETDTTVIGNVALVKWEDGDYGTLSDGWYTRYITPTNMQKGYDISLTVSAVAAVTNAQGTVEYKFAKANDNTRTMEAVALAAYLDNQDDSDYAYLNKYYGTATAYNGGYVEQNTGSTVSFAEDVGTLSEDAYACVEASRVALTDGVADLTSCATTLELGKTYNVSIFDGDKAYTKPMKYVTQTLDEASDLSIFALTDKDVTGYYVVTEDIDAGDTIIHTDIDQLEDGENAKDFDCKFKGVFDGNGHTVAVNVTNGGLFGVLENATVQNVKFIFNVQNGRFWSNKYFVTALAHEVTGSQATTKISNVYAELNPAENLNKNSSTPYALSLISNGSTAVSLNNVVVVNNENFTSLKASTWVAGALFFADAARATAVRDEIRKNVFVIAPETLGTLDDEGNPYYVPMSGGTAQQGFASNDTAGAADASERTGNNNQCIYANVTRYSDMKAFVEGLAWQNNVPDFIMQDLLISGTTAYVGETAVQNNGEVAMPLNVAQSVALKIGETALTDVVLSCNDGDGIVEINNDALTLTGIDTATVTATGKMDDMSVSVTFTVTLKATTYEEVVLFSGADGDVDTKTIFGKETTLAAAFKEDGTPYTVADGKITDLTNTANAPVDTTVLLQADNDFVYVTFKVYTKLIDGKEDLVVFSLTQDTVANITGCYLVTKDIDASDIAANAHTDIRSGDWNFNYAFSGTFDGGGHTVTANVDKGGLFGNLMNATITNVNFVFNVTGSRYSSTDKWPSGLAYGVSGSQATTTISNVYAELNPTSGLTAASSREWALSLFVSADKSLVLNNVVVVNNDDFANLNANANGWGAALINFHSGRTDSGYRDTYIKNVFVIAPEKTGNGYYVPMSGRHVSQGFASNDTAGAEAAKTNTGNSTQYIYAGVTRYSTLQDFVDGNAWNGVIPDFVMNEVNAAIEKNAQS